MVGASGFEPPTSWSRTEKSVNLKPCGCRTYKSDYRKILLELVHRVHNAKTLLQRGLRLPFNQAMQTT